MNPIPALNIFLDKDGQGVLVMHAAPRYQGEDYLGGDVPYGAIEKMHWEQFRDHGLPMVVTSLNEFVHRRGGEESDFDRMSPEAKEEFFRSHRQIGVSLRENGDLWLDPIHYPPAEPLMGFSKSEERITVASGSTPPEFWNALCKCFEIAD